MMSNPNMGSRSGKARRAAVVTGRASQTRAREANATHRDAQRSRGSHLVAADTEQRRKNAGQHPVRMRQKRMRRRARMGVGDPSTHLGLESWRRGV